MTAVDFADVVNPTNVLVRDLTCDAHFTMKTRERRAVTQEVFGKKLQRNRLAQLEIIGAVNFAHAAFAEQPDDAVTIGEDGAGYEPRVIDRIERHCRR